MFVGASSFLTFWEFGGFCIFWTINVDPLGNQLYAIMGLFVVFPVASTINLGAISLERTHATFRPFEHRLIKKKIFGATVAIVWITAGIFSSSFFLFLKHLRLIPLTIFIITYASCFLLCLLIISVCYTSIAIKIVCGTHPPHHGATNRERKLTKTLFIVTVVSLLLILPVNVLWIHVMLQALTSTKILPETLTKLFRLPYFFYFLFYANSLLNPFLYSLRMPGFRRPLFHFFKCRSHQHPAQDFPLNEM